MVKFGEVIINGDSGSLVGVDYSIQAQVGWYGLLHSLDEPGELSQ